MLILMKADASAEEATKAAEHVQSLGLGAHVVEGSHRTLVVVAGDRSLLDPARVMSLPGVWRVIRVSVPYKLASRESHPENTAVDVAGVRIGAGESPVVIAGPCALEDRDQALASATRLASSGVRLMRGGALKPRTSPFSFQGMGRDGFELIEEIRKLTGMRFVTEAIDEASLELVEAHADMIQIGARNMQNFSLLRRAGKSRLPVLLKRGMSATLEELLTAADYILSGGNENVVLCERGIRTFCRHSRNTLDLSLVPAVRELSHLPILVDPSHGTGDRKYVPSMALAALAAGADGLLLEVHHDPSAALSDGEQSLTLDEFAELHERLRAVAEALGRPLDTAGNEPALSGKARERS